MELPAPILTIEIGDRTASVVEINEELQIAFDWGRPGPFITVTIQGYRPTVAGSDGLSACAGRLPDGATAARVRDVRGDWIQAETGAGAWIVAFPGPSSDGTPVVRFEDGAGKIVPRPLDPGSEVAPAADGTQPCPACESVAWEWVTKSASGRASYLRCGTCGFQHDMGSSYAPTGSARPQASSEPELEFPRWDPDAEELFAATAFPVYGLSERWSGERRVGGHGYDGHTREVTQLTLRHGSHGPQGKLGDQPLVDVLSGPSPEGWESHPEERARRAVSALLFQAMPFPRGLTEAQFYLRRVTDDRERERRAAEAPHRREVIDIDGRPHPFEVVEDPDAWAAVAVLDTGYVVISGAGIGVEEIELVMVSDLAAYGERGMAP